VEGSCKAWRADRCENRAYDRVVFGLAGGPAIDFETTLLAWRNTFRLEISAELGSAHIDCLCKWGPSTLTLRRRIFPSGRPEEETTTLICPDPTWAAEYTHFQELCRTGAGNIQNDIWIQQRLQEVMATIS
jgi:hypothetical protein